jgi:hypothetical protein
MKRNLRLLIIALVIAASVLALVACSSTGKAVDGISINSSYTHYDAETIDITLTARNNNADASVVSYTYKVELYRSSTYLIYSNTYTSNTVLDPGSSRTEYLTFTYSTTGCSLADVNRVSVTPVSMELKNVSDASGSGSTDVLPGGDLNDDQEVPVWMWVLFAVSIIAVCIWIVLVIICGSSDEEEMGTGIIINLIIAAIPAVVLFLTSRSVFDIDISGLQIICILVMGAAFGLGIGAVNVGMGAIESWIVVVGSIGMACSILGFLSIFLSMFLGWSLFWIFALAAAVFAAITLYIDIRGEDHFL